MQINPETEDQEIWVLDLETNLPYLGLIPSILVLCLSTTKYLQVWSSNIYIFKKEYLFVNIQIFIYS